MYRVGDRESRPYTEKGAGCFAAAPVYAISAGSVSWAVKVSPSFST